MAIGSFIRRLFGPFERQISDAYRAIFLDVDAYVENIRDWVPGPRRILEVGCGEGAVSERLARAYPDAEVVGIDIAANVGRLYAGPAGRVRFVQRTIDDFAADAPERFDLIVLSDVLHHVPLDLRRGLLDTIRTLLAPGGSFAFKEWERTRTPIYWLCYFSDRWITGDRIRYLSRAELHDTIRRSFGDAALVDERRVAPWRNNISMLIRP